jgi:hypothetical protein
VTLLFEDLGEEELISLVFPTLLLYSSVECFGVSAHVNNLLSCLFHCVAVCEMTN